jgi:hypothetical protein
VKERDEMMNGELRLMIDDMKKGGRRAALRFLLPFTC